MRSVAGAGATGRVDHVAVRTPHVEVGCYGEGGLPSRIRQLKLCDHEPHLILPAVVIPVAGHNTQFLEEPRSLAAGVPQQLVTLVSEVKNRVQQKRQDVQCCKGLTVVLAAVSEIVFQVVALRVPRPWNSS